jgi:hypothetical protein
MDWREDFDTSLLDGEALLFLIDFGWLSDAAVGITRLVMDKGLGYLSEKQLWVFKAEVIDRYFSGVCRCCQCVPEAHELIGFWENDRYCSSCANRMANEAHRDGITIAW